MFVGGCSCSSRGIRGTDRLPRNSCVEEIYRSRTVVECKYGRRESKVEIYEEDTIDNEGYVV